MSVVEGPRDQTIESPCISVCALDENDFCVGCQRTVSEITRWSVMSAGEKQAVLALIAEREHRE